MIVAFKPGGTINDVRVVLRFAEKLPRRFNTERAEIYMEQESSPALPWITIKAQGAILPENSPHLSEPELAPVNILDLTTPTEQESFGHVDIIEIDEVGDDEKSKTGEQS